MGVICAISSTVKTRAMCLPMTQDRHRTHFAPGRPPSVLPQTHHMRNALWWYCARLHMQIRLMKRCCRAIVGIQHWRSCIALV